MSWSKLIPLADKILGYFGPKKHEERVLRKFIGRWDKIRPHIKFDGKRQNNHLGKMDKLRKELR